MDGHDINTRDAENRLAAIIRETFTGRDLSDWLDAATEDGRTDYEFAVLCVADAIAHALIETGVDVRR